MTKISSKKSIKAISISLLFFFSSIGASVLISPATASPNSASAATPLTQMEANWAYPNGNQFNQDYQPQNVINSSNAQYLGLAWIFPLPTHPTGLLNVAGGLGDLAAPLIVNGTIYAITQFYQVFALNAANGNVIWTDVIPLNPNSTVGQHTGPLSLHGHDGDQQYTTALFGHTPTLWYQDPANRVWAINAINGHYELNFTDFVFSTIDGNSPTSTYHGIGGANILVDQNRGILISSHGAETSADNGRCFFRGWNILANPPVPLWTTYCTPPQPGGSVPTDANWDINQVNSMQSAQIFYPGPAGNAGGYIPNTNGQAVVNLKTLSASVLNSTLYNDWGYVNQSPACSAVTGGASTGSTGAGWGGAWLLGTGPTAGMAFVNTNNRDPYGFGSCTPGPDLWSAAILALNETNGQWVWGFQANAHDVWDYDCSWWQAMGNETINGVNTQVVFKSCKAGYVFEINAKTGNLIYAWTAPQNMIPRCPLCYMLNPLNRTQMTYEFFNPAPGFPTTLGYPFTHEIENEPAFNPATNTLFIAAHNAPTLVGHIALNHTTYFTSSGISLLPPYGQTSTKGPWDNMTVFAVNAGTGQMQWTHFIDHLGFRGGVSTSGNIVYLALAYGDLLMLNAQTGDTVKDLYIGGPLNVLPSIGATQSGQMMVIFPISAGLSTWSPNAVPGDIVALNLQIPAGGGVTTNVVTTTATVAGGTTTVTAGGATSTLTVGAGKTATITVGGSTTTITGATQTVTASGGGGVNTTTLYGVAAVAVIFIIATGYLAMRGRKPAP